MVRVGPLAQRGPEGRPPPGASPALDSLLGLTQQAVPAGLPGSMSEGCATLLLRRGSTRLRTRDLRPGSARTSRSRERRRAQRAAGIRPPARGLVRDPSSAHRFCNRLAAGDGSPRSQECAMPRRRPSQLRPRHRGPASLRALARELSESAEKQEPTRTAIPVGSTAPRLLTQDRRAASAQCDTDSR